MKAKEKETLYTFFRTALDAMDGFRNLESWPSFIDDGEESPALKEDDISSNIMEDFAQKRVEKEGAKEGQNEKIYSSLEEIKKDVSVCTLCPLCKSRTNTVFGDGPKNVDGKFSPPPILVIGEAPGADEDAQGLPFVGASGKLLDKMLMAIGLSRTTNCFIANMVKCRPANNRNPQSSEIECCSHFLSEQIRLLRPKMILILGTVALKAMLKTSEGISHLHGKLFQYSSADGSLIPTIATYHPSALLRDENLKRPAWDDLKFFRAKMAELDVL